MKPYENTWSHVGLLMVTLLTCLAAAALHNPYWQFACLGIPCLLFLLWDICYVTTPDALHGRTSDDILKLLGATRQYLSWFVVLYGVAAAYLMTEGQRRYDLLDFCGKAHIPPVALVLPFITTCIAVLFIPIRKSKDNNNPETPSDALKSMFCVSMLLQKLAMTATLFIIIRLMFFFYEAQTLENVR